MSKSLYAALLQQSFESLKSSADPDSRPTGDGPTIELSTPESDVLGKIIPVKNDLKAALQTSGWLVKGDGTLDVGEEKGPTPAEEPSTEASGHDPATVYKLQEDRKLTNEQNLVINGVFIPDLIQDEHATKKIAIMTPNDVIDPTADVIFLTEDDEHSQTRDYLSTEGYKVATTVEELIAILKS